MQAAALEVTLRACDEAATWASGVAFEKDVKKNFALRERTYGEIKARWRLGAQAAQHVIKKMCDAYATLKANLKAGNLGKPGSTRYRKAIGKPITFRPEGAQPSPPPVTARSWPGGRSTASGHASAGCGPSCRRRTLRPPSAG
ncbi:hypothetical protein ABZ078_10630 [Streptomyces sp. NPDC006385]|uniref:hypothetical protein n=1 Tax=Streptomyces sp. NPDC006385 TaxID=3156761 RepID=UPI0033AC2B9E